MEMTFLFSRIPHGIFHLKVQNMYAHPNGRMQLPAYRTVESGQRPPRAAGWNRSTIQTFFCRAVAPLPMHQAQNDYDFI
jgi:hypothetical protein